MHIKCSRQLKTERSIGSVKHMKLLSREAVFDQGIDPSMLTVGVAGLMREFGTLVWGDDGDTTGVEIEDLALREAFASVEIERRRVVANECWLLAQLDESEFTDLGHRW